MRSTIQKRLSMAERVLEFSRAHPSGDPSYAGIVARLEANVAKADQLARQQLGGENTVHASTRLRRDLRRALHDQLRHLARVGDVVGKTHPELVEHFRLPLSTASAQAYRMAAGAMLQEAQANRDLLLKFGMASTLLDDLGSALKEYEHSVEQGQAGRRAHIGAVAELAVVSAEIMDDVQLLDGLNRYRFRLNADLRAEWESSRNIVATPKPPEVKKPAA